jgi:hypothetical protein
MNFDDLYMLKLSIRLSDYDNSYKYFKKLSKSKIDEQVYENLAYYNTDLRIFKMFEKDTNLKKHNYKFILNLMKNPFNNFEIIEYMVGHLKNKEGIENKFYNNDESIVINLLKNSNSRKKIKTFEYILNYFDNFNFNERNSKGETNSQILLSENPTNIDSVFLEKIENLFKNKTEENKFLFFTDKGNISNRTNNKITIQEEIKNFLKAPKESYKIRFADIEYNLLRLNIKLRRMYEFSPIVLIKETALEENERFSRINIKTMEEFIFEKLLVDKI